MEQAIERIKLAEKNGSTILDLSDLGLYDTPKIPNNIEILILNDNNLSELPILPVKLTDLYVDNNQIADVGTLPEGLVLFSCVDNEISSFSELPNSLEILDCRNNYFKSKPEVPKKCKLFIIPSKYHEEPIKTIEPVKPSDPVKPSEPVKPVTSLGAVRNVPEGERDGLNEEEIKEGDKMIDLPQVDVPVHGKRTSYDFGPYFKNDGTARKWISERKTHPMTRKTLKNSNIVPYVAHIVPKAGGKRKTKKNRRI